MKRFLGGRMALILAGAVLGAGICLGTFFFFLRGPFSGGGSARPDDTLSQIEMSLLVSAALYEGNYTALSAWVSPEKGLTVVPFSTVDPAASVTFTAAEVRDIPSNKQNYIFGVSPIDDLPIDMVPAEFFQEYMQTRDFSAAPVIGVNRVIKVGNAAENIAEAYPDCVFVDLYYPPGDPLEGVDWISMKLVLEPIDGIYVLTALVRSVYTQQ